MKNRPGTLRAETGLTLAYLRECFDYDPENGKLIWRTRPPHHFPDLNKHNGMNTRFSGKVAGSKHRAHNKPEGSFYIVVKIKCAPYQAHRVIWALTHALDLDDVPPYIDHKDLDGTNNRIGNLRVSTSNENMFNVRAVRSNNTTGFKGVILDKYGVRYGAQIRANKKQYWLGTFDTAEEASAAYTAAAKRLHGDFARTA